MLVNREDFLHSIESVKHGLAASAKGESAITQSTCFVFMDGQVMTYNDFVACRAPTKLGKKLTAAVPSKPLMELIPMLDEETINIDIEDGHMVVAGRRKKSGILIESTIQLPIDKVPLPEKWKELPQDFGDAVSIVQECVGTDEESFATVCIHIDKKWLEATDRFQVCRYHINTGIEEHSLVRKKDLQGVVDLGMNKIGETEKFLHFKNPNGLVMSCCRYIMDYPTAEITEMLKVTGEKVSLPKNLVDTTKRTRIFSADNSDNDTVTVEIKKGKMRVRGHGATGFHYEIKNMKYDGKPIAFAISPKLLADITQRHNSDCEIGDKRLKIDGGKFIYITCLGEVKE